MKLSSSIDIKLEVMEVQSSDVEIKLGGVMTATTDSSPIDIKIGGTPTTDNKKPKIESLWCNLPELDNSNPMLMTETQIIRIAQASGQPVEDVMDLLEEYKRFEGTRRKMKGLKIPKEYERGALFVLRRQALERNVLLQKRLEHIGKMYQAGMLD
ncbi:hypothetical protein Q3G72_019134 [Acer saccharum]|nr:hypothetical protein Q3G72_019134 [Acer saccharum]